MAMFESVRQMVNSQGNRLINIIMSLWGLFCIVFLFGDKVMIDELGREYLPGGKLQGEWILLFLFLSLQLLYNLFIVGIKLRFIPYGNNDKPKLAMGMNEMKSIH